MDAPQRIIVVAVFGLLAVAVGSASAAPMSYTLKDLGSDFVAGTLRIDNQGRTFASSWGHVDLPPTVGDYASALYLSGEDGPQVGTYVIHSEISPNYPQVRGYNIVYYWDGKGRVDIFDKEPFIYGGNPLRPVILGGNSDAVVGSVGYVMARYNVASVWHRSAGGGMILEGMNTAYAINNLGQVVGGRTGLFDPAGGGFLNFGDGQAVLYDDGDYINLNDLIDPSLGWHLRLATGINDSGQIVGTGINAEGQVRYYELTPNVPEPATIWSFGILAVALAGRRLAKMGRRAG